MKKESENMSLKELNDVTYFDLNNEINIPVNNQIPLNKDKEALDAFLEQNVTPNTKKFTDLRDRFDYLLDNDYIEPEFFNQYDFSFIENLSVFNVMELNEELTRVVEIYKNENLL